MVDYTIKDLCRYVATDALFYIVGCTTMADFIGWWTAGIVFILLCLISFERARNEKHYEMIKDLNGDIEKVRKELSDYKNQVLEG